MSFPVWPVQALPPADVQANVVPFSRSGGRSLNGINRATRSDRGFWRIALEQIPLYSPAQHRTWNAIRTMLGGQAGLIIVPAWSFKSAPYASGEFEPMLDVTFDDEATYSDGSSFAEGTIAVEMADFAPLSATVVTLRAIRAGNLAGVRFSYQHAFYETGPILEELSGGRFRVSITPAIRRAIPAGSALEVNEPTCLVHLAEDAGMEISEGITPLLRKTVQWVEAVDFWSDLAAGLADWPE